MEEPKYIAYRIDLKRFKEFYDIAECEQFFKAKKESLTHKAKGYNGSHITGLKINERWMLFDTDYPAKYVQEVITSFKDKRITWN